MRQKEEEADYLRKIGEKISESESSSAPLLQAPDFADQVSVAGGVGLDHVLDVVRLERLLEATTRGHVLQLQKRGRTWWSVCLLNVPKKLYMSYEGGKSCQDHKPTICCARIYTGLPSPSLRGFFPIYSYTVYSYYCIYWRRRRLAADASLCVSFVYCSIGGGKMMSLLRSSPNSFLLLPSPQHWACVLFSRSSLGVDIRCWLC